MGYSYSIYYGFLCCFVQYDRCFFREKQENGIFGDSDILDIDRMFDIQAIAGLAKVKKSTKIQTETKKQNLSFLFLKFLSSYSRILLQ